MFCCTLLYVPSSFAIILMGKRELVALLSLSSWCLLMVVWLFLAVPWVCLPFVIVVFPDHTHLVFLYAMLELQWIAFCALEYTRSRLGQLLFFINFQLSYGPFLILTRKSRHTHNCRRGCYNNQTNNDLYLSKGK